MFNTVSQKTVIKIPKTNVSMPKKKTKKPLQYYYHVANNGRARGYDQLNGLIKRDLSLKALRFIIIFPLFLNTI